MRNVTRSGAANQVYLFAIFLLAASLPFSKFLISISEILLLVSWLAGGHLAEKIIAFSKNKIALAVSSVFLLHLLGLLYTSDFNYGGEDVRKKIPLLLLPLIFSTSSPLPKNIFNRVLAVFVFSTVTVSLICFYALLGYTGKPILQPQQASLFMSHIRFGLLIAMSVFILGYFFAETPSPFFRIPAAALIAWLIAFLIMLESETGLLCILAAGSVLLLRFLIKGKGNLIKAGLTALFILAIAGTLKLLSSVSEEVTSSSSPKNASLFTKKGNPYSNDTLLKEVENGHEVWMFVCEKELSEEWSRKSSVNYSGKDLAGNDLKYTLIRYLTSKGLKKDAEGVDSLSKEDVHAIEKGIANVHYTKLFNPAARIQKIIWEFNTYLRGGNPSGHSVVQRLEFWKAAAGIIRENPWFGVGTGDVDQAFQEQYRKMNSPLSPEWRLRSHNQFLAIGTAFGIAGLAWFLFSLFYPFLTNRNYNEYLYLTFFIIAFLSMLTEDTLETQTGVTFFAFFNSLFLFCPKREIH